MTDAQIAVILAVLIFIFRPHRLDGSISDRANELAQLIHDTNKRIRK